MSTAERPAPNCVRYGLGDKVGFVELLADGSAGFCLGNHDPMDYPVVMTSEHLPVLREIVAHLERGGF